MNTVRTRFAPSPTGFMHVGSVRTALFDWLIARQNNGQFILRIEDTDKTREVEGSTDQIIKSLKWLGLNWDEGVDIGGPYGPYIQSKRLDIYKEWANRLVKVGRAYADPYTPEEIEDLRLQAQSEHRPFLYREYRPENPPVWDGTLPLRFKSDPKPYTWNDAVMGKMSAGPEMIDDFILIKSDGYPTYNFCHIVDDQLMKISHVLRSQEYISSIPKYLNLYEAYGINPPIAATLPFVMAMDGKKKLSKRDNSKNILDYAREGYLPEALLNFLATLGWNDGTEQEVFTLQELVDKFRIDKVQKSPARFDEKRLIWLNGQHIRRLSIDDLYKRSVDFWPEGSENFDDNYKKQVLGLIKDRLNTLSDLRSFTSYFFNEPTVNWDLIVNEKYLKGITKNEIESLLETSRDYLKLTDFESVDKIDEALNNLLTKTNQKPAILFSLIRLSVSWSRFSPALASTLFVIGKERVINRLNRAVQQK